MADSKNRTQLQKLFKSGAKPSEADFKDLIDGSLNIADDGIEKPSGADKPLKVLTYGDQENVLDIYTKDNNTHTWRINQKPTAETQGLNLETGGSSKLFVESSTGNLGLGVTKPIAKLHIQQSGNQNALRIDDEAGDTTPLIIDAEGKVGIGTDQPNAKLDVKGNTAIAGTLSITQALSVKEKSTLTGNVGIGTAPTTTEKLKVSGNTAIAGTLSITGKVGIGTTPTTTEKLKVNGNTAIAGNLSITKDLSVDQNTTLTGKVIIGAPGFNGDYPLRVEGHNASVPSISVRNTATTAIEAVATSPRSAIYAENTNPKGQIFVAYVRGGQTAYAQSSSISLKKNIRPLQNSLETILKVEGVRFVWKESNIEDIGFIAEHVGEHIPEAITYGDDEYATSMSYNHIIPMLVEAMKEQQKMIQNLQEAIHSNL